MQARQDRLTRETFDVLVIGGGISGACIAWDATLRGLSVALVEREDFGAATSSASSKLLHGGIRYLQQGLLGRVRESAREQAAFRRIAPHLVAPLTFLIPTYGLGARGKPLLRTGLWAYRALIRDIGGSDDAMWPRQDRALSRAEALAAAPGLAREGLTGAVQYEDYQMWSSERMTLSVLQAAAERGAVPANYTEVRELLLEERRVVGARVQDTLDGTQHEVRARLTVNAAGPWAFRALGPLANGVAPERVHFAKGMHLVVRQLGPERALALSTHMKHEAVIHRGGRHIFLMPWRGHTLIGTTYEPCSGRRDDLRIREADIAGFLDVINAAYPGAKLARNDVRWFYAGLYPLVGVPARTDRYQGSARYRLYDHARLAGIDGLVTALGAKYTTARALAERCTDLVLRKLGREPEPCATATTPIYGGKFESMARLREDARSRRPEALQPDGLEELLRLYGGRYTEALEEAQPADLAALGAARTTPRLVVRRAARHEMARRLGDVVFRRTGIGTIGDPGEEYLHACAAILAEELGWSDHQRERELEDVRRAFCTEA
ncbi:MAG: FAD-dependent oxidoreductase [Planctomycetota bacterium]